MNVDNDMQDDRISSVITPERNIERMQYSFGLEKIKENLVPRRVNLIKSLINFICFGVSSQASVAHLPARNFSVSNLHRPPFLKSIARLQAAGDEQRNQAAQIRLVADEQNFFRRGFQSFNCRSKIFALPSGRERVGKFQPLFQLQSGCNDFRRLFGAQKRAGKNHVEVQFHFFHRGGDFPELPAAFWCERTFGVVFKIRVPRSTARPWRKRNRFHAGKHTHLPRRAQCHGKCNIIPFWLPRRRFVYFGRKWNPSAARSLMSAPTRSSCWWRTWRGRDVQPVHEESRQTRLGKGFYETHRLQPEAIARTAEAVWEFAETAAKKTPPPSASSPPARRATR